MNPKVTNPAVQAGLITQETLEGLESLQQRQDEAYANSTPLDRILAAEIERLEKNYGLQYEFILIANDRTTFSAKYCTSPMSTGHAKDLCGCLTNKAY